MIRLALAQPGTAVLSFDLCCATPVLPVATGRQCSLPPRLLPRQAINAPRQRAASVQIPIASDAQLRHTSRGFLLWRFAYAGPTCPPHHHHGTAIRKPSQKWTSPPSQPLTRDGLSVVAPKCTRRCQLLPSRPRRCCGSGLAAGEDILLDDCVDAPISIHHLGDAEVDANGNQRDRLILGQLLGCH
jgi:hypothetical protein